MIIQKGTCNCLKGPCHRRKLNFMTTHTTVPHWLRGFKVAKKITERNISMPCFTDF